MKIISWNCNGALRKKVDEADSLDADVLIIQECEDPAFSTKSYKEWAGEYLWIGTSKNKGIGIFPKKGNTVTPLEWNDTFIMPTTHNSVNPVVWKTSDLKLFLPFKVNDSFNVLSVWTKGSDQEVFGYIGQFWKYLQIHREQLSISDTLIIGDFNSNSIWDKPDKWWSHSNVVNELANIGIKSLYHHQNDENQGQERTPTFYHQRNLEKPYHIDYAFCSENLLKKGKLRIGEVDKWLLKSDHMPLILNLEAN